MIVQSMIIEDARQSDKRRWVRERHTFDSGASEDVLYLAEAGDDANAQMQEHAAAIEARDAEQNQLRAAQAKADGAAAVALLKLTDADLANATYTSIDEIAAKKLELQKLATAKDAIAVAELEANP